MTSKFAAAIPDCQMETFDFPPDHGQHRTFCAHFAVQIHLVVHHSSHTPNFERQSRVGGRSFRTHMHGSHRVHGELIDRYKTNDHTQPALFCVFTPGLDESQLFCVYICGHQCRRRTAQTDRASFVSNSVNLFLFSVPTTGNVGTPFSAVATQPCDVSTLRVFLALSFTFAILCPLLLCSFLLLTQPHSIGISQNSAALR